MLAKHTSKKIVFSRILMLTPLLIGMIAFQAKEPNSFSTQPSDLEGYNSSFSHQLDTGKSSRVKPVPPDGMRAFMSYIGANYKYPKEAIKANVRGRIVLRFVVGIDGSISNIKIIRDLGFGTGEEAVRVLENSDKWEPGYENGVPVRVRYTLPIVLNLPSFTLPQGPTHEKKRKKIRR